jgi:tetratricopeptide (TPR) repeat protein
MVWYAWKNNTAVIDATGAFMVIHQCHDYGHVAGGWQAAWKGEEAKRNIALAEGKFMSLGLTCTHVLDKQGLHPGRLHDGSMGDSLLSRRLSRGIEEFNSGRFCEALDYFNDALERSGSLKIESLHYLTAVCFFHLKKYAEAINAIQNELAAWPDNDNAKTLLSTLRNHIK